MTDYGMSERSKDIDAAEIYYFVTKHRLRGSSRQRTEASCGRMLKYTELPCSRSFDARTLKSHFLTRALFWSRRTTSSTIDSRSRVSQAISRNRLAKPNWHSACRPFGATSASLR
jgi:hypothetical protein